MAFNPKYTITPKINKALVEIERVRGFSGCGKTQRWPDRRSLGCAKHDQKFFKIASNFYLHSALQIKIFINVFN